MIDQSLITLAVAALHLVKRHTLNRKESGVSGTRTPGQASK
jgi:hypothetical protein